VSCAQPQQLALQGTLAGVRRALNVSQDIPPAHGQLEAKTPKSVLSATPQNPLVRKLELDGSSEIHQGPGCHGTTAGAELLRRSGLKLLQELGLKEVRVGPQRGLLHVTSAMELLY